MREGPNVIVHTPPTRWSQSRLDDPARIVIPVEGQAAVLGGERVEDDVRGSIDEAVDPQLVGHRVFSTWAPNRSSRRSHVRR